MGKLMRPTITVGERMDLLPSTLRRLTKLAKSGEPLNAYEAFCIARLRYKGAIPPAPTPPTSPAPHTNVGSVGQLTNAGSVGKLTRSRSIDALTNTGSADQLTNAHRAGPASIAGARVRASSSKKPRAGGLIWWG